MKKTALIMAAMLSAAVSCTKEQIHEEKSDKPEIEAPGESKGSIPMEFTAVSDLTRTSIGELNGGKREISWVKDDEIKIIYNNKSTTAKAETTGASTIFKANVDEAPAYYAVYPSSAATVTEDGSWKVAIPAKQDVSGGFGSAHYAAAVAKDGNLAFRNICGWLRFTIADPSIKSVLIRGNGEQFLAGNLAVTFDEEGNIASKTVSNGNSRIIVNVNGAGEYYVAVLPDVNLENGVGFRFYTSNEIVSENAIETGVFSSKALSVEQGKIVNLGGLDSRIVTDWWISPSGTGDGKSADSPAAGVEFLRAKLAQDVTSDKTRNGLAKGYGCMGITIHAAAGEYDFAGQEINVTWPGHTSSVGTTILGAEGTIFKNTGSSRFFKIGKSVDLKFENITFDGGNAGTENGGAIWQNDATAILAFKNCAFKNNKANNGGAIYMAGSNMTSESTSFSDNTATTAAGAVGIAGTAELVSFTDCDFTSNTAGKHGGALQNYGGEKTRLTVTGGTFSNNKTTNGSVGGGAAITFRGEKPSITIIDGVVFSGNSAGCQGGAVRVNTVNDISIKNSVISDNKALDGAGLYVGGAASVKIDKTQISGNQSKTYAGGIYVGADADVFMNACSIFGNSNTTTTAGTRWGAAIFVLSENANKNKIKANICLNNSSIADHTTAAAGSDTNIDMQGGNLVFANSTMIASTTAGMLRIHTSALSGTFINSVIVNKNGKSINYNGPTGKLTSKYVLSGIKQNAYNPTADIDKAGLTYANLGSPAFDAADHVYKWNGTMDVEYPSAPTKDVVGGLIKTANESFYNWLLSVEALDVDQLGNSRAVNRQGAYCGN
mgnify:FL=1